MNNFYFLTVILVITSHVSTYLVAIYFSETSNICPVRVKFGTDIGEYGTVNTLKFIICLHFQVTVKPRLSEPSIIRTRDPKKMQGQSTHCDHVTQLRMRSKPTPRIVATREPAAALLLNLVLTLKEVKETQGKCSINRG